MDELEALKEKGNGNGQHELINDLPDSVLAERLDAMLNARSEACMKDIQDVLKRHRCDLRAIPQITEDGRLIAVSQIVARR